jgi:RNA-directed DNA polymerase
MASHHINKRLVISLDIKDFFHSIKQNKLNDTFLALGIGALPARTLSELCTYKAFVPQGALTSPKVSNLITAVTFGPEVKAYCDQNDITISIYADDLTMSTNAEVINTQQIISDITQMVERFGFRINRQKTKVMWKTRRQYVCGAVVNSKVNLLKKDRLKLRAIVHNITQNGLETEAAKTGQEPAKFLNHIRGRLNWFNQLNPLIGSRLSAKLKAYLEELKLSLTAAALMAATSSVPTSRLEEEVDKALNGEATVSVPW